jgi:hypothetical protein
MDSEVYKNLQNSYFSVKKKERTVFSYIPNEYTVQIKGVIQGKALSW